LKRQSHGVRTVKKKKAKSPPGKRGKNLVRNLGRLSSQNTGKKGGERFLLGDFHSNGEGLKTIRQHP